MAEKCAIIICVDAGVSELADETDSKSVVRKGVWVRVPPPAGHWTYLNTE